MVEGVKATVARNLQHPFAMECAVVGIVLLDQVKMHLYIRRYDIRVFHILEKLCATLEILLILAVGQGGKLNLVL